MTAAHDTGGIHGDNRPNARPIRFRPGDSGLGIMALLVAVACSSQGERRGPPTGPVPVTADSAAVRDVPVTLKAIGSVQASNTVLVRARVGGELERVAFADGQIVKQGELLFQIDRRPFEIALEVALADSARDSAKAASAAAQEQRYAELVRKDYVTKQQYDEVGANAEALRATVRSDQAAIRNARLNLSFCSIRAPISGRTGGVLVRRGNLVRASDENPLVTIRQLTPIYVNFSVPESRLPEIRHHAAGGRLRVEAMLSGDGAQARVGELTFIDNVVDQTTGTIVLRATFPNGDEILWPGQFVNVVLTLTTLHDVVVIPTQAVQNSQQGVFVYVIGPDLTVTVRPITVKLSLDDEVVVEEGLQVGERVVTDGQLRLSPGAKVDILPGT